MIGPQIPTGVDAVVRQQDVAGHRHVGGGEANGAAAVVAVLDHAVDLRQAPEQTGRELDVARSERVARAGGGDGSVEALQAHELQTDDLEAALASELVEQRDVALAAVAEVEVLADDDEPRVQLVDDHLAHELLGALERTFAVEVHDEHVVDAGRGQQLELLGLVDEQRRSRGGPHDGGRVAVECHEHARAAELGREPPGLGDQRRVPDVNTVEGADRDRCAPLEVGQRAGVVEHLHVARLPACHLVRHSGRHWRRPNCLPEVPDLIRRNLARELRKHTPGHRRPTDSGSSRCQRPDRADGLCANSQPVRRKRSPPQRILAA